MPRAAKQTAPPPPPPEVAAAEEWPPRPRRKRRKKKKRAQPVETAAQPAPAAAAPKLDPDEARRQRRAGRYPGARLAPGTSQRETYALLAAKGPMTVSQIAEAKKWSRYTAEYAAHALLERGLIRIRHFSDVTDEGGKSLRRLRIFEINPDAPGEVVVGKPKPVKTAPAADARQKLQALEDQILDLRLAEREKRRERDALLDLLARP